MTISKSVLNKNVAEQYVPALELMSPLGKNIYRFSKLRVSCIFFSPSIIKQNLDFDTLDHHHI